jgi:hypothetical protein
VKRKPDGKMTSVSTAPVLMKSKERVQKHGEVFTPQWVVDKTLAYIYYEEQAKKC